MCIRSCAGMHGSGRLPEDAVCEHNSPSTLKMQLNALTRCEEIPPSPSLDQSSFKIYRGKVEICSEVRLIDILTIWKSGILHPLTKEQKDHLACY